MASATVINKLVERLNRCREDYYNNGLSELSDEEFDFEEERLRELDPNNSYFLKVGNKTATRDISVDHEIPMLSMQKVQTAEEANDWYYKTINIPNLRFYDVSNTGVWIDPKLDGVSGKVVYDNNGKFKYASTRGDGKVGAILKFGKDITGVPERFLPNSELRGEFVISKKFQKFYGGPLRNICTGILKRDTYTDDIKNVTFVIYDAFTYQLSNEITFSDRKDKLRRIEEILTENDNKFTIIPLRKTNDIAKTYEDYVNNWRDKYEFETDGMILTVDGSKENYTTINEKYKISTFNRYNIALKPPAESASSKVTNIHVYVNRVKLSFVAEFKPVFINGVKIERATLDNYSMMRKLNIGIGSNILVKRGNDVIPKIIQSYNPVDETIILINPKRCPSCGSELVKLYKDLACVNEYGCKDLYISKLDYILTNMGVKNIGLSTIIKFVNCMIENDVKDFKLSSFFSIILDPVKLDFYMDNIFTSHESKSAIRFKESIFFALKSNLTEVGVIGSFNIPFIGEKALINNGITNYDTFIKYVKGLDSKTVLDKAVDNALYNWYKDTTNQQDLKKTIDLLKPYCNEITLKSKGDISYCISGEVPGFKNKQEFIQTMKTLNPKLNYVNNVSVGLGFLVSEEKGTTKVLKAIKYNIPILSVKEAISKYSK